MAPKPNEISVGQPADELQERPYYPFALVHDQVVDHLSGANLKPEPYGVEIDNGILPHIDYAGVFQLQDGTLRAIDLVAIRWMYDAIEVVSGSRQAVDRSTGTIKREGGLIEEDPEGRVRVLGFVLDAKQRYWEIAGLQRRRGMKIYRTAGGLAIARFPLAYEGTIFEIADVNSKGFVGTQPKHFY